MQGYCMKCRMKREMQDVEQITMKNGRPATRGKCRECGTKIVRIGAGVPVNSPGETMKRILPLLLLVIGAVCYFLFRSDEVDDFDEREDEIDKGNSLGNG